MNKVVVTGLGFVSSIGNSIPEVIEHLREMRHGFEDFPASGGEICPPKLYGAIQGFATDSMDPEDWSYPARYKVARNQIKGMSPHVLYSYFSTLDALADASLELADVSNYRTGLYSASAGSSVLLHHQLQMMNERGVQRCSPFGVVASTVGTINFSLGTFLKIKGAVCGMASACASSAHAMGFAHDAISSGRQDRMIVIGAEDGNRESILPFAAMRALTTSADPMRASCPFDVARSGFVGTGGASTLILESEAAARARGARIYAEFKGWGEAGDGHSPAMSHPEGEGLIVAMHNALAASKLAAGQIDYVNAHGTSTPVGDFSEIRALKKLFVGPSIQSPAISSSKALTGHALSMAGALESGICCLAIREGFKPGSAHIQNLDPECEGLNILRATTVGQPGLVMSNSCGFGGANVSLIFGEWNG
jgi:3-oxoacyl-[acyl-carrier-protein] synthase-1